MACFPTLSGAAYKLSLLEVYLHIQPLLSCRSWLRPIRQSPSTLRKGAGPCSRRDRDSHQRSNGLGYGSTFASTEMSLRVVLPLLRGYQGGALSLDGTKGIPGPIGEDAGRSARRLCDKFSLYGARHGRLAKVMYDIEELAQQSHGSTARIFFQQFATVQSVPLGSQIGRSRL